MAVYKVAPSNKSDLMDSAKSVILLKNKHDPKQNDIGIPRLKGPEVSFL